jgi:hypothetical protein
VYVGGRRESVVASDSNKAAQAGSLVGPLWFIGWLFTWAFAKLIWWQIIVSLVIWPYYLGVAAR